MVIANNEIHLWYVYDEEIRAPELLAQYLALLNAEERLQQQRFYFEKHRHQYLVTRAMVRSVLSHYVEDILPAQWEFRKNDYGKPFIGNNPLSIPLYFNISHAEKLTAIAVCLEEKIGLDVEFLQRDGNFPDMAKSFFSPRESHQLFTLPKEEQVNRFFDIWTLKEAYIKACGKGLSIPLDHFSYEFLSNGKIKIDFVPSLNDDPACWQFWRVHMDKMHKVAIGLKTEADNCPFTVSTFNFIPLLDIVAHGHPVSCERLNVL